MCMANMSPKSNKRNNLQPLTRSPEPTGTADMSPEPTIVNKEVNNDLANEMLRSIALAGEASSKIKPIIGGNIGHILNFSSGSPRLHTNIISRFALILSQPTNLSFLNPFEIRCALCKRVISYPCWYYEVKYAVNHFHYFVCFDKDSVSKPSTKCYRRSQ